MWVDGQCESNPFEYEAASPRRFHRPNQASDFPEMGLVAMDVGLVHARKDTRHFQRNTPVTGKRLQVERDELRQTVPKALRDHRTPVEARLAQGRVYRLPRAFVQPGRGTGKQ